MGLACAPSPGWQMRSHSSEPSPEAVLQCGLGVTEAAERRSNSFRLGGVENGPDGPLPAGAFAGSSGGASAADFADGVRFGGSGGSRGSAFVRRHGVASSLASKPLRPSCSRLAVPGFSSLAGASLSCLAGNSHFASKCANKPHRPSFASCPADGLGGSLKACAGPCRAQARKPSRPARRAAGAAAAAAKPVGPWPAAPKRWP
mmetsp:Transcript_49600/g.148151  ORF Transcript_49600/g.148151 Transcript_49600/m.148151 type:complete len:203 (-) Transcript_49600:2-610(-)